MPQGFDSALAAILDVLEPHERDCAWASKSPHCERKFKILAEDISFYKKLRVPPPTLCPSCRRMRRLGFALMLRFYKQPCAAPGHSEEVISIVPLGTELTVYDWDYYRTYEWDPFRYGVPPDAARPTFDLLWGLRRKVPQPAIVRDPSNVDSEYTVNGRNLKHGYFVSGGWRSEHVYYSVTVDGAQDCLDCYFTHQAASCYESTFSRNLNDADFIYFSNDCYASRFLYDCKNCHDCFGCVNLRNKRWCFFNEQLTEEEYRAKVAALDLGQREVLRGTQERFWKLVRAEPMRALRNQQAVGSVGNYLIETRNCYECYAAEKSQDLRFAETTIGNKDSMDYAVSGGSELLYETVAVGSECSNVKFSFGSKLVTDSEFVINCRNVNKCFGCIGLENQSYCIFNKKYEPEEYARKVDEIKAAMLARGEYGEFFPLKFSSYAYNDSFADIVFPLKKEEATALGTVWYEEPKTEVHAQEIPGNIRDVKDDITKETLVCEVTGRPFRIVPYELEFYRRKGFALPTIHPNERIARRYALANPYRLYDATCARCGVATKSMRDPKEGLRLYCEKCYQEEIV